MSKRAAIILAGGKGHRFQTREDEWQDKALAHLLGKPLLVHVVENVCDIVDEIIVVVNENKTRVSQYVDVLTRHNLPNAKLVIDLKIKSLQGPLIAILTGLKSSSADVCLVIPADMPMVNKKVADYMFNQLESSFVEVPMWPNGKLETLLMVLQRKNALIIAQALCQLERSHPDDIIRGSQNALLVSPLGEIQTLDPELKSFVNINSQEDLNRLQPRQGQGSVVKNLRLNFGTLPVQGIKRLLIASAKRDAGDFVEASKMFGECAALLEKGNQFFWAAVSLEFEAKSLVALYEESCEKNHVTRINDAFLRAAQNYGWEAKIYEEKQGGLLAERAKADQVWCQTQIRSRN